MRRDSHDEGERDEGERDDRNQLGCAAAVELVPGYLDEELSEEQAAPLRRHLLACHACREHAQAERALRRWFVPSAPVAVPEGFAARVTQLAFSGATGSTSAPGLSAPGLSSQGLERVATIDAPSSRELQRFVLRSVAIAAAVLLAFALALHWRNRPAGEELYADDLPAMVSAPVVQRPVPRESRVDADGRAASPSAPKPKSTSAGSAQK